MNDALTRIVPLAAGEAADATSNKLLEDATTGWWQDPRMCPHLHLPLQSGDDAVLRRMARNCSSAEFSELVAHARTQVPDSTGLPRLFGSRCRTTVY